MLNLPYSETASYKVVRPLKASAWSGHTTKEPHLFSSIVFQRGRCEWDLYHPFQETILETIVTLREPQGDTLYQVVIPAKLIYY